MQDRDTLLKILYRGFLDIRLAARGGNLPAAEKLSNLLHTIPLAIVKCGDDPSCDRELLHDLFNRAAVLGMSKWVEVALHDIKMNEGLSDGRE